MTGRAIAISWGVAAAAALGIVFIAHDAAQRINRVMDSVVHFQLALERVEGRINELPPVLQAEVLLLKRDLQAQLQQLVPGAPAGLSSLPGNPFRRPLEADPPAR